MRPQSQKAYSNLIITKFPYDRGGEKKEDFHSLSW